MTQSGILTFHNTPNYGATLQCYALSSALKAKGCNVEIINYCPPHPLLQYAKSLFLGKRRGFANVTRIRRFRDFVQTRLKLSGPAIYARGGLAPLARRYDVAFTGSDEVWKVDRMRPLDPTYYLDFCDAARTRICSYAASASTVTDLREYRQTCSPLLSRFHAHAVRDPNTADMVRDLTGTEPTQVVDPTFLWDFTAEPSVRPHARPYIAVYSWFGRKAMEPIRALARERNLDVVCVGCRHPDADVNALGIGPAEWLDYLRHSELVVTDFFHGIVFTLLFKRRLFAHVDPGKRMKLTHMLGLVGHEHLLHSDTQALARVGWDGCAVDHDLVQNRLAPLRSHSMEFIDRQLAAVRNRP